MGAAEGGPRRGWGAGAVGKARGAQAHSAPEPGFEIRARAQPDWPGERGRRARAPLRAGGGAGAGPAGLPGGWSPGVGCLPQPPREGARHPIPACGLGPGSSGAFRDRAVGWTPLGASRGRNTRHTARGGGVGCRPPWDVLSQAMMSPHGPPEALWLLFQAGPKPLALGVRERAG